MKKLRLLPLLFLFLGLFPGCCEEVEPFFMPGMLSSDIMMNQALYSEIESPEITSTEGLQLWLSFDEFTFMAEQKNWSLFQQSALATQPCPEPGHAGLKSQIIEITITSTEEFQGVEAGNSINEHFHALRSSGEQDDEGNWIMEERSVESTFSELQYLYYGLAHIELNFSNLPANNLAHVFTVELIFEDGTSLTSSTETIQF